jgi:hypothetical protein
MEVKPKEVEPKGNKDAPLEKAASSRLVQPQRSKTTMPAHHKKHKSDKKYFCCFGGGTGKKEIKPELQPVKE